MPHRSGCRTTISWLNRWTRPHNGAALPKRTCRAHRSRSLSIAQLVVGARGEEHRKDRHTKKNARKQPKKNAQPMIGGRVVEVMGILAPIALNTHLCAVGPSALYFAQLHQARALRIDRPRVREVIANARTEATRRHPIPHAIQAAKLLQGSEERSSRISTPTRAKANTATNAAAVRIQSSANQQQQHSGWPTKQSHSPCVMHITPKKSSIRPSTQRAAFKQTTTPRTNERTHE